MSTLDDIRKFTPYALSEMASCGAPDTLESPGAEFLASVRDSYVEAVESDRFESEDAGDVFQEIANGAPDVYTAAKWAEFVDLAAYQEEPELGEWPSVLDDAGSVALYQIAYRLCVALADDLDVVADDDTCSQCGPGHLDPGGFCERHGKRVES